MVTVILLQRFLRKRSERITLKLWEAIKVNQEIKEDLILLYQDFSIWQV